MLVPAMTYKEAIIILEGIRRDILPNDGVKRTEDVAFDLAIKALEFQDKVTNIITQAIINSECDSLEEFCEKHGVAIEEAENESNNDL